MDDVGGIATIIGTKLNALCGRFDVVAPTWIDKYDKNPQFKRARELEKKIRDLIGELVSSGIPQPSKAPAKPGARICKEIKIPEINTWGEVYDTFYRLVNSLTEQGVFSTLERTTIKTIAELIGFLVALDEETLSKISASDTIPPSHIDELQGHIRLLRPLARNAQEHNDMEQKGYWIHLAEAAMGAAERPQDEADE